VNVQGEQVKKLDVLSNEIMVEALTASDLVCTMVSEEMDEPLHLDGACGRAPYVVCFDPLDGSSNIDVNVSVGTIFSILRRHSPTSPSSEGWTRGGDPLADVLQPGAVVRNARCTAVAGVCRAARATAPDRNNPGAARNRSRCRSVSCRQP